MPTYLGAYFPVRWIEWSIMAALLTPRFARRAALVPRQLQSRPPVAARRDRISCVADIPFIPAFDGPVLTGRFLC